MKAANRRCCDGLCNQGRRCPALSNAIARAARANERPPQPAFAPGVIEGPRRRGGWAKRLRTTLKALGRYLMGPQP